MEERIAYERRITDRVNAKMIEMGVSPLYLSDLEIEEIALAAKLKEIRINKIFIGLGVILIITGATFLILWLKGNIPKNKFKSKKS